jgi:hypothetical protein
MMIFVVVVVVVYYLEISMFVVEWETLMIFVDREMSIFDENSCCYRCYRYRRVVPERNSVNSAVDPDC